MVLSKFLGKSSLYETVSGIVFYLHIGCNTSAIIFLRFLLWLAWLTAVAQWLALYPTSSRNSTCLFTRSFGLDVVLLLSRSQVPDVEYGRLQLIASSKHVDNSNYCNGSCIREYRV